MTRGWKLKYMPINLAIGMCPDTPKAFFSQQNRWCMGSTTLLSNKEFWVSPLTYMQKACFLSGMSELSSMTIRIRAIV
jgi:cellulose synthase/poly-beta-1,6-N-acetylglucosamine synthase-like glycosyltransferase